MPKSFGEGGKYYTDEGEMRSRSSLNKIPDYKEFSKKQTEEDKKAARQFDPRGNRYGVRKYYGAKPTSDSFVPMDELPGGENPEDLLIQIEEGNKDDGKYQNEREVEEVRRLDEMQRVARRQEEATWEKEKGMSTVDESPLKEVVSADATSRQSGVDGGGMSVTSKTFESNRYSEREIKRLERGRKKLRNIGSSPNTKIAEQIKFDKYIKRNSDERIAKEEARQKYFEELLDRLNKKITEGEFGTKTTEKVMAELGRLKDLFPEIYKLYSIGFDEQKKRVFYRKYSEYSEMRKTA